MIPQTLNINNYRTASAKLIQLHIVRKLMEYSFKNAKAMFILTNPEGLLFEVRLILRPAQLGTGSEKVNKDKKG